MTNFNVTLVVEVVESAHYPAAAIEGPYKLHIKTSRPTQLLGGRIITLNRERTLNNRDGCHVSPKYRCANGVAAFKLRLRYFLYTERCVASPTVHFSQMQRGSFFFLRIDCVLTAPLSHSYPSLFVQASTRCGHAHHKCLYIFIYVPTAQCLAAMAKHENTHTHTKRPPTRMEHVCLEGGGERTKTACNEC